MPDYDALGHRLFEAYENGSTIAPFSADAELTIEDAYRIQAAVIDERIQAGGSPIGYKLGFTNQAIQTQYGVDQPAYGVLLDTTVESGPTVSLEGRIEPRVEPEIAFLLEESVPAGAGPYEVLAATRALVPVVEVVDCRMEGTIEATDAVADNALAAGLVPGETTADPRAIDVDMEAVQLRVNGRLVESGTGAAVLEHPAKAVAWLADTLAAQGTELDAGQLVSTGSMTTAWPIESGDVVEARFANLGTVTFSAA